MKKTKNLYAALLAGILLFSGCAHSATDETDAIETTETILETESPEPIPAKHEISVAEVESLLAANGLRTNTHRQYTECYAYHSGHQMRVVHTERGTYAVFVVQFGDNKTPSLAEVYITKMDNDGNTSILYYTEYKKQSTVVANLGQDTNGDIYVAIGDTLNLSMYVIDHATDEVTAYSTPFFFSSEEQPGYSRAMFDFANRKIYIFYTGGLMSDNCTFEWYTFDMETKQWAETSNYITITGDGRYNYPLTFPDGNGGAYIVARKGAKIHMVADQLVYSENQMYIRDELRLFHIPDLTNNGEGMTYVTVEGPVSDRGHMGIWSEIYHTQGDSYMDANGYLHIVYQYYFKDFSGTNPDLDTELQFRHAVYDGMECIYNEKIALEGDIDSYKPIIRQSKDGTLYMILSKQWDEPSSIEIHKAKDELGTDWELVATHELTGLIVRSTSVSATYNGSTQDDVLSIFCFAHYPVQTQDLEYAYTFDLSLEDYSITEPLDILNGFDLRIDDYLDNRAYNTAHNTKIIHTENASYAAFVYDYDFRAGLEYYHIVKIDKDNNVTILLSDSYTSEQDRYMTMWRVTDGAIYVCPPTGNTMYTIDPSSDAVAQHEINKIPSRNLAFMIPHQRDFVTNPETGEMYVLSTIAESPLTLYNYSYDPEKLLHEKNGIKYTFDCTLIGSYSQFHTLSDGGNGVYIVATRSVDRDEVEGLEYSGHTLSIHDALMLFYIPDLADTETVQCIDIQLPDSTGGTEGIWSVVNCADAGDVYLDSEGKLHIFYTMYNFDFDDADRRGNPALVADTLKHYHAVFDGTTLVSREELGIEDLNVDSSIRMAETTDGTPYLLVCNIGEAGAKIDVYCETEEGWKLAQTNDIGEFTAESFSINSPRSGSVQDNVIDCIVYATDNDVYFTSVIFE